MTTNNDVFKFNTIVEDVGGSISELTQIGREGFNIPLITTADEMAEMVGLPMGPWQPLSHNLIWFYTLKATVYARQILEESNRIFQQLEDKESARKVKALIEAFDTQFNPCQTAFQVYSRLLACQSSNGKNGN